MKISTRLSTTFSIIGSGIFITFGITVYFFSSYYRKHDFQERLKGRIEITEKIFLEKESFTTTEFEKIKKQFLHTLPKETEEVLPIIADNIPVFKYNYPQETKDELLEREVVEFENLQVQGTSKIFRVKGKNYLIIVTAVDEIGLQYLSYLRNIIAFSVLASIPLIFIISFVFTRRALLPISKKIAKANSINAANLHQRLEVFNPNDEIGKMAIAFNKLLDRLEISFETQKSFIRNASHEIRNPLTAIMGEAEITISKVRTTEEYIASLTAILTESETLNTTVNNLLQLSKITTDEENIHYEIIHFDSFMEEVENSFEFINPMNKIHLTKQKEGDYSMLGNASLLKTGIINLLDNACKFSSNNAVEITLTKNADFLELSIKDKGIGILESDIERIATPFYRGNNALKIKGSGIGLSLSTKIINLHRGEFNIKSQIEIGTEVLIKIPLI